MSLRDERRISNKTAIERDAERTITDLLVGKEVKEPIRVGKKIIQTGDSQTTITYELNVNPNTGQQEVVERISTSKKSVALVVRTFRNSTHAHYAENTYADATSEASCS